MAKVRTIFMISCYFVILVAGIAEAARNQALGAIIVVMADLFVVGFRKVEAQVVSVMNITKRQGIQD
ncbi:hypothetical protein [Lentilactobacillus sp. Marseille-Q4993]|uniref:hypothetical protein n=1 Tax=Lentilactobacillus sp. Marseille-Q4993 TaxID=3039492 RepID=UPI0024BD06E2|nr:hypothetical protein [Lentilactobacillus sp. Marseille-Q4993]